MSTRTHTARKSSAPTSADKSPAPVPVAPSHDDTPAPDIATQLAAAARGHRLASIGVSAAPLGAIQPKLTVGAADDTYEREADRVAGQVMRMPDSAVQRVTPEDDEDKIQMKPDVQRVTPEDDEDKIQTKPDVQRATPEDDEDKIQAKPDVQRKADGSFDAGAAAESRIAARRGGGSPLPDTTRAFMEPRFGADFGGVRVHADAEADRISQNLSARAFTTGSDIYFSQGEYSPSSSGGQELLAHELTHVVQQSEDSTQYMGGSSSGLVQRKPGDSLLGEVKQKEADGLSSPLKIFASSALNPWFSLPDNSGVESGDLVEFVEAAGRVVTDLKITKKDPGLSDDDLEKLNATQLMTQFYAHMKFQSPPTMVEQYLCMGETMPDTYSREYKFPKLKSPVILHIHWLKTSNNHWDISKAHIKRSSDKYKTGVGANLLESQLKDLKIPIIGNERIKISSK